MRPVRHRKWNMWSNEWDDAPALREERRTIETVNSQLAAMGIQRPHVRTVPGLELKVHSGQSAGPGDNSPAPHLSRSSAAPTVEQRRHQSAALASALSSPLRRCR